APSLLAAKDWLLCSGALAAGSDRGWPDSDASWLRTSVRPFGHPLDAWTPCFRFDVESQHTDSSLRANGYNHAMSIAAPRWVGVAGLLGLLAGSIVLIAAPGNPGAIRLSGGSLLWWSGAVAPPPPAILRVVLVGRAPAEPAGGTSG